MSDSAADTPASGQTKSGRTRHRWFVVVVVVAVAAGALLIGRSELSDDYKNANTTMLVVAGLALLSVWYVVCGGLRLAARLAIVGVPWIVVATFLLLFRPRYTGDMAIAGWQFRYGATPDAALDAATQLKEISDWQTTPQDYPRFLGSGPWPEVHGVALATDWQAQPPEEVWRQEIGAGWSAFAVVGPYAVTQEQRGELEMVTCYRVDTGELVWSHGDVARFDPGGVGPSMGDIGPRATPTIHDGRVLTQGATGLVNCLDARSGRVLWSHDTAAELGVDVALWGKSNSPLVVDDMVIVSVGAPADVDAQPSFDASLVAYDLETGAVRWTAGRRRAAYASPVLATLAGERQILMINERYLTAHRASDGAVLWEFPWGHADDATASVSQPVPVGDDRVFLSKAYQIGSTLLKVAQDASGTYHATPVWDPPIKQVMKTKLTNVVVRDGYVYGLDGTMLECIELATGSVRWKKRRQPSLGHGQLLLVGDVLLVLSEQGELVAVEVSSEAYRELGSLQVLDAANVTWNNPALASPYLLVRNSREAACYRLPLAE